MMRNRGHRADNDECQYAVRKHSPGLHRRAQKAERLTVRMATQCRARGCEVQVTDVGDQAYRTGGP
jgi:hypothetical protein